MSSSKIVYRWRRASWYRIILPIKIIIQKEKNLVPAHEKGMTGEEKASHSTVRFMVAKINTKCTTSAATPCAGLWNKHPTRTALRNSSSQNKLSKFCCSLFWVDLFFKKQIKILTINHSSTCRSALCHRVSYGHFDTPSLQPTLGYNL